MAASHGTIDCITNLQAARPRRFDAVAQIQGIESRVGKAAFEDEGWIALVGEKLAPMAAQMSIQHTATVQCVDGEVLMRKFSEEKLNRSDVMNLMGKVAPVHDESFPGAAGWRMKVDVAFEDGVVLEESVPKTHLIYPGLSNEEMVAEVDRGRELGR